MLPVAETILNRLTVTAAIALMLVLGATPAANGSASGSAGEMVAEVVVARLNLRSEARLDCDLVAILNKGDRVRVLRRLDGWLMVDSEGLEGYVRDRDKYVRLLETAGREAAESLPADPAGTGSADSDADSGPLQADMDRISRKESEVLELLNHLDRKLNAARIRSRRLRTELVKLNGEVEKSERSIVRLKAGIRDAEGNAGKRVAALYKIHRMGRLNILASAKGVNDLFRLKSGIAMVLERDQQEWVRLAKTKSRLQSDLTLQRTRLQEVAQLEQTLKDQMGAVRRQLGQRSQMLAQIKARKSLAEAALAALKRAGLQLDATIGSLNAQTRAEAPPPAVHGQLFSASKGLLPMPVDGKVIAPFGPYLNPKFNIMNFRSGVEIQADRGEPVHAVGGGQVLFASWFKGYGNMMILDHGGSYYTVYAHVEEMFKHKGQRVLEGEVIATVGDTGSHTGARLYFEVRHHGKPQDPLDWISEG
jgi:septal ring factor EnvC (AmiA/AmiB activator)